MFAKKKKKNKQFETIIVGNYSIQQATIQNIKDIRRLVLEAAKSQPSLVGLSYAELKKYDNNYWNDWVNAFLDSTRSLLALVMHKEKLAVGFLMVEADPEVRYSHTAVLTPMYVQDNHRDEVIEQQLLTGAIDFLHQNSGVKKIKMCLTPDNSKEFPLYGSAGFARFGFDEDHLKVGKKYYDCVLLVKSF